MTRIIQGVVNFQRRVFGTKQELFRQLGKGQNPSALFITCSDSRINPNLLTQTEPGELFILRNAGNLVPPVSDTPTGEAATVEYAVVHLKVRDIIVCGHSKCGAMHGLLEPAALANLPGVARWLAYAEEILPQVRGEGKGFSPDALLNLAIEKNVLLQVEHVKSYPPVAAALAAGALRVYAWVYHFEDGHVDAHDPSKNQFVPLTEAPRQKLMDHAPIVRPPRDEFDNAI
jgi:carbonic anhydrase